MTDTTASSSGAGAGPQAPWPSARVAWYAVFVFFLAQMVNFLDRQIVALLVEPIKRDLVLTDTQISLVMGFAFVVFYVLLGLPIARLADRSNRRNIIGVGLIIWSGMTAACGLARNFWVLFGARVGVGVGEACTGPATFSMLSDLFPRDKLPRAIALMNFGYAWGVAGALLFGGAVVAFLASSPTVDLGALGTFYSWQVVFFVVGLPGLVVAALMFTVPEPVRRGRISVAGRKLATPPIGEVVSFVWTERAAYIPIFLGLAIKSVLTIGSAQWLISLFIRTYGWEVPKITLYYGLMWLILAPLGAMFGSWLSERFFKGGRDDANLRVVFLSSIALTPIAVTLPLMPSAELAMLLLAGQVFVGGWVFGPQNAALQVITPNEMRGQITALFLFMFNVIGFGLGPTFVALMTDFLYGSDAHLRYAMATAAGILGPTSVFVIWSGLKGYGAAVARARARD
jgi:MFS family permease